MGKERSGSKLKQELTALLMQDDFGKVIQSLPEFPAKKTVNILISFLCHRDDRVRWRSVSALGCVVSSLSERLPEEARIIMRRFMWMLNEESGGIGWGVPEVMGDILARSPVLDREYNRILLSYLDEDGNFLDHEPLRQGVLWAMTRVSEIKPDLMNDGKGLARDYLTSDSAVNRGLACIIAENLGDREAVRLLNQLTMDKTEITLYNEGYFNRCTVSGLAGKALKRLS